MDVVAKIKGSKIQLSAMQATELDFYYKIFQEIDVEINLGKVRRLRYKEDQEKFYDDVVSSETDQYFTISDIKTGELYGTCGLYDINFRNERASVIIVLDKKKHKKGVAMEAMQLMFDYGFSFLSLNKISAYVYAYNKDSLMLFNKLGFKEVGKERSQIKIKGKFYDRIIMDILRDEFYTKFESVFDLNMTD